MDMSKKSCIIIHGCPSNVEKAMDPERRTYDKHWIPWIRKELILKDIKVELPLMPEPWDAKYEAWKEIMDNIEVNDESILIGHSCGGAFLVRWLGETKKKIKKLILVAPAKILEDTPKKYFNFYNFETDVTISERVEKIIIFVADDESKGIVEAVKKYSNEFGIDPIELKGMGHFTLGDMGTEEFPELLEVVLE